MTKNRFYPIFQRQKTACNTGVLQAADLSVILKGINYS